MGVRLDRKKRTYADIGYLNPAVGFDFIDNGIKEFYRINDSELDLLCEKMTDAELHVFISDNKSIKEKRLILEILNKYLE